MYERCAARVGRFCLWAYDEASPTVRCAAPNHDECSDIAAFCAGPPGAGCAQPASTTATYYDRCLLRVGHGCLWGQRVEDCGLDCARCFDEYPRRCPAEFAALADNGPPPCATLGWHDCATSTRCTLESDACSPSALAVACAAHGADACVVDGACRPAPDGGGCEPKPCHEITDAARCESAGCSFDGRSCLHRDPCAALDAGTCESRPDCRAWGSAGCSSRPDRCVAASDASACATTDAEARARIAAGACSLDPASCCYDGGGVCLMPCAHPAMQSEYVCARTPGCRFVSDQCVDDGASA